MDPNAITLILTALGTGAAAAAKETAGTAIHDAYQALKELLKQRFAGKPKAEAALIDHEDDPETYERPMKKALIEIHADQDEEIMRLVRKIITQDQAAGQLAGTHQEARGHHILQVGGNITGGYTNVGNSSGLQQAMPQPQRSPAEELK